MWLSVDFGHYSLVVEPVFGHQGGNGESPPGEQKSDPQSTAGTIWAEWGEYEQSHTDLQNISQMIVDIITILQPLN